MYCLNRFQVATCPLILILVSCFSLTASAQEDLADMIERCEKSVVRIEVHGREGESLGSGFVVDAKGTIVTNVHVLAGATKAKAVFADGKTVDIKGTLHYDKSRDICIASLASGEYLPIKVHAKLPRKGETVTALGAPRGLSFTATTGIVSAIRKGDTISPEYNGEWVQIDAALSPGNSGGPIINRESEVIAMSTLASRGDSQNLNFGISCSDINDAIEKVVTKKKPLKSLASGIGKVVYDKGGPGGPGGKRGGGPPQLIRDSEIPAEALADYIADCRKDYSKLNRRFKEQVSNQRRKSSAMKRGVAAFPRRQAGGTNTLVVVDNKGRENYFFRNERVKERESERAQGLLDKMRSAQKKISKDLTDESLAILLKHTGGFFEPHEVGSIGFMKSGTSIRAFNANEAIVEFDEQPYLMWFPSTSGMATGNAIPPTTVYVAGTETIPRPGRGTVAMTVLIAVSDAQIKSAIGLPTGSSRTLEDAVSRKWTSGKYTVMATLMAIDEDDVTLKTDKGKEVVVPRKRLSEDDHKYLKAFE